MCEESFRHIGARHCLKSETCNSQPITHNSQPITHNSQPITPNPTTDTAQAYHDYQKAKTFANNSQYDSAAIYYQKASVLYERAAAWKSYVRSCNRRGINLRKKGSYQEAETCFQTALEVAQEHLSEEHHQVAISYNNLGTIYQHTGDYDQALDYYKKALDIKLHTFSDTNVFVANSYHNIGAVYDTKGNYDQALDYYEKALQIRLEILGESHPGTAVSFLNIGIVYQNKGDYNQALDYYSKASTIQLKALGKTHPHLATSYLNMGIAYNSKGDYDKSLDYHKKAQDILLEILGEKHTYIANNYLNIGLIYDRKGNYNQSLHYHKKALDLQLQLFGEMHPDVASSYHNIGIAYDNMGNYYQALGYIKKALEIHTAVLGPEHRYVASGYHSMGSIYRKEKKYDRALDYYKKSLDIQLKTVGDKHPILATNYINIGMVYKAKKDYDRTLYHYTKALNLQYKTLQKNHPDIALSYQRLGVLYYDQRDFKKALHYYQKSITTLVSDFRNTSIEQNPALANMSNETNLLDALKGKARMLHQLYVNQSQDVKDLRLSVATYRLAIQLINKIKSGYKASQSKLFFAEKTHNIYKAAIHAAMHLYRATQEDTVLQLAFTFAEESRAGLLREILGETQAKAFAGIPDSLLEQERTLKIDLNYYEAAIQEQKDSALLREFENRFFALKNQYETLVERFEKDYPKYYELKYDLHVRSVKEVQESLVDAHTALIEYTFTDTTLFAFCITKEHVQAFRLPVDPVLSEQIEQFRTALYKTDPLHQHGYSYQLYAQSAYPLYRKLIAPVLEGMPKEPIKRLILVPDGPLQALPFEGFLTAAPDTQYRDFRLLAYLFRDYSLSYAYSATVLMNENRQRKQGNGQCLAFAPAYESSDEEKLPQFAGGLLNQQTSLRSLRDASLGELPGAFHEVRALARLFDGAVFMGEEATERHFKETVGSYSMIHLALHGKADSGNPMNSRLFFTASTDSLEDNVLHAYEVYNLQLRAALAVLSGCETGVGQYRRGEGLMSLARAFSYAGCPSVLMSLWKVDDRSTSELMKHFYEGLADGLPKDEALRLARLNFLDREANEEAHPFFWAAFITVGDSSPVLLEDSFSLWQWLVVAVLLLLSCGFLYRFIRWKIAGKKSNA